MSSKETGDRGELFVEAHVPCPNCGKRLQRLPPNYPLFDVQCMSCLFRAQVKAATSKPTATIRGAGYNIMEAVLKTGGTVPPLINVSWWKASGAEHSAVRFFPFIPRTHLKSRPLKARPGYRMFNYVRMSEIPHFTLKGGDTWGPAPMAGG